MVLEHRSLSPIEVAVPVPWSPACGNQRQAGCLTMILPLPILHEQAADGRAVAGAMPAGLS